MTITSRIYEKLLPLLRVPKAQDGGSKKRELKLETKQEGKKVIKLDKKPEQEEPTQTKKDVFDRVSRKKPGSTNDEPQALGQKPEKKVVRLEKRQASGVGAEEPFLKKKVKQPNPENDDPAFNRQSVNNLSTNEEKRKRMQRFGTSGDSTEVTKELPPQQDPVSQAKKKQVRCKHFPNCNNTDEDCPYVHPKENCKYFPACTHGEKCLFLHPEIECKFGVACTRANCAYKHPGGKGLKANPLNQMGSVMQMMLMMQQSMHAPKPKKFAAPKVANQQVN